MAKMYAEFMTFLETQEAERSAARREVEKARMEERHKAEKARAAKWTNSSS